MDIVTLVSASSASMVIGHTVLTSKEAKVYNISFPRLHCDAVPVASHLQCANVHRVELHVVLTFV